MANNYVLKAGDLCYIVGWNSEDLVGIVNSVEFYGDGRPKLYVVDTWEFDFETEKLKKLYVNDIMAADRCYPLATYWQRLNDRQVAVTDFLKGARP